MALGAAFKLGAAPTLPVLALGMTLSRMNGERTGWSGGGGAKDVEGTSLEASLERLSGSSSASEDGDLGAAPRRKVGIAHDTLWTWKFEFSHVWP